MMSKVPCLGCGVPVVGSRCVNCTVVRQKASRTARGYGYDWQKMRIRILNRDNWTCYLCNKKLIGSDATVDHITPLAKDMSSRLDAANLAACCRSCNSRKQNR